MATHQVKLFNPDFLGCNPNPKSFLDALSVLASFVGFPDLKIATFSGLPSLWISEEEISDLAAPFTFSLVGKFPNHRPPLDLFSEFSMTFLDAKHALIFWIIVESLLIISTFRRNIPLSPFGFRFLAFVPLSAPRILHCLCSIFGRPLRCDNATSTGSHPLVAHVLVELDVLKQYHHCVWIGSEKFGYI
ncbi:hypothetical protein IEQ34_005809 [Dendrobium chrysotoxum]|uniref:Uncharacterized protein n=1 Tax=Dendrobium chrysotoxum TaxID=161865 RepID=A0AAV7H9L0_DENCH|nr:hypothetical protein IEQ34_005809 [Dendrobium chrysotoxum]